MERDNPADRLVAILEEARGYNKATKGIDAWRAILCDDVNTPLYVVTARYGKTATLIQEIIETCERHHKKQAQGHEAWSQPISQAFSESMFGQSISEFNRFIPDHVLTQLHTLSALFDMHSKLGIVSKDQLIEFKAGISTLLDEVLVSDLSEEVKKYLARALQSILTALNEYRISGSLPVIRVIESVGGHILYDEEYRNSISGNPTANKAFKYLHDVAAAITVVTSGADLMLTGPAMFQKALSYISDMSSG